MPKLMSHQPAETVRFEDLIDLIEVSDVVLTHIPSLDMYVKIETDIFLEQAKRMMRFKKDRPIDIMRTPSNNGIIIFHWVSGLDHDERHHKLNSWV